MPTEEILENTRLVGISRLYSWSTNYDYKTNPFAGFLDLIGYSDDNFGERLVPGLVYDFVSLDLLAEALKEFTHAPYDAEALINELLESEEN